MNTSDHLDNIANNFGINRNYFFREIECDHSIIYRMYKKYFGRFSNSWSSI